MSYPQDSPWASGEGFGTPRRPERPEDYPQTLELPTSGYTNPTAGPTPGEQVFERYDAAEPSGWSQPQHFGPLQPSTPYSFGQRLPYDPAGIRPEHPNAVVTLTLGIVGLVTMFFGFPFISPIARYLGAKARREVREQPGAYRDSSRLNAGHVLGVVGTLLSLAFILLVLTMIALFATIR
ncbi:MAG: hypothetical protein R2719_13040 [Micropruina sp.]